MADRILYEKRGRRYVPTTEHFQGFPRDGVWLVTKKGQEPDHWSGYWMMRLADKPTVATQAAFARHKDLIAGAIHQVHTSGRWSYTDMADSVIEAIVRAEEDKAESK